MSSSIDSKVVPFGEAVDTLTAFVAGDADSEVDAPGGPVPTLRRLIADVRQVASDKVDAEMDALQEGVAQAVAANQGAGAAKQGAEEARDMSQTYAGINYRPASVAALNAIAGTVNGQTALINVGGAEDGVYTKAAGVWSKTAETGLAGKLDKVTFSGLFYSTTGPYRWWEMDPTGRMSRFVTEQGRTWLRLHSAVEIPGAQIVPGSVPGTAFAPEVFARMLPADWSFGSVRLYPLALMDPDRRLGELTIDNSGRFPDWVAKALGRRAGAARAGTIGRSVRVSEVYVDATQLPDGPTVPMDTGQASTSFGIAPMYVSGGKVVHDAVRTPNNGGYVQVALAKKVSKIGATCIFPPGSEKSAIALVIPVSSWASDPGGSNAPIHFVLEGGGSWHCSYFAGQESNYGAGTVAPLTDGLPKMVDLEIDGDAVKVTLPDGSLSRFSDPRIGANMTNLAIWELYEPSTQPARAAMTAMWADSPALVPSKQDARPMAVAIQQFLTNAYQP